MSAIFRNVFGSPIFMICWLFAKVLKILLWARCIDYMCKYLERYDKIKLVDEISLIFPELIIGKYVKIRFKNRGSPCYFLSSRGQKIKNITKLNKRNCFCLHSWLHVLWHFLHKNWFTQQIYDFVFGSYFEQDHLLNFIFSGVYVKR